MGIGWFISTYTRTQLWSLEVCTLWLARYRGAARSGTRRVLMLTPETAARDTFFGKGLLRGVHMAEAHSALHAVPSAAN